jgi:hypothetical protein
MERVQSEVDRSMKLLESLSSLPRSKVSVIDDRSAAYGLAGREAQHCASP